MDGFSSDDEESFLELKPLEFKPLKRVRYLMAGGLCNPDKASGSTTVRTEETSTHDNDGNNTIPSVINVTVKRALHGFCDPSQLISNLQLHNPLQHHTCADDIATDENASFRSAHDDDEDESAFDPNNNETASLGEILEVVMAVTILLLLTLRALQALDHGGSLGIEFSRKEIPSSSMLFLPEA